MKPTDAVVGIVRKLVCAMIQRVDEFSIQSDFTGGELRIKMRANTGDVKRIVGRKGRHLASLLAVAWRVAEVNGIDKVVIGHVESTEAPEVAYEFFKRRQDFDRPKVLDLVEEVVTESYPGVNASVMLDDRDDDSCSCRIRIETDENVHGFGKAMHALFVPIGMKAGRIIYVVVEREGERGVPSADTARGSARPAHVPGTKPVECRSAVPGEHRGELG